MSTVDGPRGVKGLYRKVMVRLRDACKDDFRSDGIDKSVLDTMLQLWDNSLHETQVMDDDFLGDTDRKGQPRETQKSTAHPEPTPKPKEPISTAMKRQIEDIIMLSADAVVSPELTRLLQQHSSDAMSMGTQPGSVRILQSHGWDGSRFLGRVDGQLLRKMADSLVVYIHRSTTEMKPGLNVPAPLAAASAAPRIPQTDGADGMDDDGEAADPAAKRRRTRYGEESSEDEVDAEDGAAASGAAAGGESDLNSDDDDIVEEAEEETSLILCQYKRVKKSKNKYTLDLQNGIVRIFGPKFGDYGREYVFAKAQANLDWGK